MTFYSLCPCLRPRLGKYSPMLVLQHDILQATCARLAASQLKKHIAFHIQEQWLNVVLMFVCGFVQLLFAAAALVMLRFFFYVASYSFPAYPTFKAGYYASSASKISSSSSTARSNRYTAVD